MKIINNTSHDTKEIKVLMRRLFIEQGIEHKGYLIYINRTNFIKKKEAYILNNKVAWRIKEIKQKNIRGRASIGFKNISLWLPDKFSVPCFEYVFVHELMHTLGLRHEKNGLMRCHYPPEIALKEPFMACSEVLKNE